MSMAFNIAIPGLTLTQTMVLGTLCIRRT
jgi:hypothetical protein